jgi:hypothetical protein
MAPEGYGDARYGLVLEVYRFDGSFVSFVHDLPPEAIAGLTLNHFIAVDIKAEREQPVEVYARLNVQHGPNVEQMVRQVDFHGCRTVGRSSTSPIRGSTSGGSRRRGWT